MRDSKVRVTHSVRMITKVRREMTTSSGLKVGQAVDSDRVKFVADDACCGVPVGDIVLLYEDITRYGRRDLH